MVQTIFESGIWNAWIFMSVFLIQMIVMVCVGKQTWEKSQVPIQAKRNKYEKHVGNIANLLWLMAMIYSIFLPFKIDTIWFYIGLVIIILGYIFIIRATYDFITTKSNQVIKKGAFAYSRHPLYLATFLILIGVGIITGSWLFLILTFLIILFFYQEAIIEERYCLAIFGEDYNNYMQRVPRVNFLLGIIRLFLLTILSIG